VTADVIVVGAGPAGIATAATAAECGADVILVDAAARPGGQIWRGRSAEPLAARWLERLRASGATFLAHTTIVDSPAHLTLIGETNGTPVALHARRAIVLASGTRELFLPFPGWTLPGVVGVGGAQALLKGGWHVNGQRVVVAGSGPLLLPVAAALADAGADVVRVIEQASTRRVLGFAASLWRSPSRLAAAARYRGRFRRAPYQAGSWVARAEGADRLREVALAGAHAEVVPCDILCTGYGLVPSVELAQLLGCVTTLRGVTVDDDQQTSVSGIYGAGEAVAIGGAEAALAQGAIAGCAAAGSRERAEPYRAARARHAAFSARLRLAFALRAELSRLAADDTIVCRCEDVTFGAIRGCASLREARLHARLGMGACQGRVCSPAARHVRGWAGDSVRPPVAPARIATMIHEAATDAATDMMHAPAMDEPHAED
jgi:NADPH-dependent 2,4-dienoyl-CoA reductase/sulfur reductase-like enzyme